MKYRYVKAPERANDVHIFMRSRLKFVAVNTVDGDTVELSFEFHDGAGYKTTDAGSFVHGPMRFPVVRVRLANNPEMWSQLSEPLQRWLEGHEKVMLMFRYDHELATLRCGDEDIWIPAAAVVESFV